MKKKCLFERIITIFFEKKMFILFRKINAQKINAQKINAHKKLMLSKN